MAFLFELIPHKDMKYFNDFKQNVDNKEHMFLVEPALPYFLFRVVGISGNINAGNFGPNVWQLPNNLSEMYKEWKEYQIGLIDKD